MEKLKMEIEVRPIVLGFETKKRLSKLIATPAESGYIFLNGVQKLGIKNRVISPKATEPACP